MKGNDEEKMMEDLKVKTILIIKLHMKDKLLDNNHGSKELVLRNEMDYEIYNEEYVISKSQVGILVVLTNLVDVLT